MGLRINTNTAALTTQYQLRKDNRAVSRAMEKLSSGYRINKSSDDAAGLAISEKMRANIRGLKQVDRNAQDGISLTQVAEGSLGQVSNILVRLRELSIQAASDTVSDDNRILVTREYNQLLHEIDRIAGTTEFNGTKLLTGVGDKIDFQVNTKNSDDLDRVSFDPADADVRTSSLGLDDVSVGTKQSAQESMEKIDRAISNVSDLRAKFGSLQSRLVTASNNIHSNLENISAANSRIKDADIAEESTELTKNNIMLQTGTAILAQANQQPGQALSLLTKG